MYIYRITVYRVYLSYDELPDHSDIIATMEFPACEIEYANRVYNMLYKEADYIVMERISTVHTVFGSHTKKR